MTTEPFENRFPWMRWLLPAIAALQVVIVALLVWAIVNRPPEPAIPAPLDVDLTEVTARLDDIASDAASAKGHASATAETIDGMKRTLTAIDKNTASLGLLGVRCRDY